MAQGLTVNIDPNDFFHIMPPEEMTRAGAERYIDMFLTGQVREVFLCPNGQRVAYATNAPGWDPVWHDIETDAEGNAYYHGLRLDNPRWALHTRLLHERGINPYGLWLERVRASGREGWLTMRMTDMHGGDSEKNFYHNTFWREHPHLRRHPGLPSALDYAHPEVRTHALGLVDEYFDLFDMDGLELDWMRFVFALREGFELIDARHITAFMREVRVRADAAAKRRGHPVRLAARVPSRPDDARRFGYDVMAWVDEGLVDWITPTNFWPVTDHDMPLELWRRLLGDRVVLAAGLELWSDSHPGGELFINTPEMAYGFAAEYWHRGADRIYLFNYMSEDTGIRQQDRMPELLSVAGAADTVNPRARRHLLTYTTPRPPGLPCDAALPAPAHNAAFRLHVGGDTAGREVRLVAGVREEDADTAMIEAHVNQVAGVLERDLPADVVLHRTQGRPREIGQFGCWRFPEGALHDGDNVIRLTAPGPTFPTITWLELHLAARAT